MRQMAAYGPNVSRDFSKIRERVHNGRVLNSKINMR